MAVQRVCGLVVGLLGVALSCGGPSTTKPTGSAGAAGQPTSGAAGASAAGSGASGSASGGAGAGAGGAPGAAGSAQAPGLVLSDRIEQNPQTEDGACVFYYYAYCARMSYCAGGSDRNCFRAAQCPDAVFSPGSTRTIESVVACARAWANWSCDELALGQGPDCALPGTFAVAEPCMFASQCSTLGCVGAEDNISCGECQPSIAAQAACNDGDTCEGIRVCRNGACEPSLVSPRPHLGEPCEVLCGDSNLFCSAAKKCEAYPAAGQPCGDGKRCDQFGGDYCRASDVTCQPAPLAGQPCALDVENAERCDDAARCEGGQCVALPADGDSCTSIYDCAPGLHCVLDPNTGTGTCRTPKQPGEACTTYEECPDTGYCTEGTCRLPAGPEKPCDAGVMCIDGRVCEGQRCAAKPLIGIYADECL